MSVLSSRLQGDGIEAMRAFLTGRGEITNSYVYALVMGRLKPLARMKENIRRHLLQVYDMDCSTLTRKNSISTVGVALHFREHFC